MLYDNRATDLLKERPECDICELPAAVDGKTRRGPWAYMCTEHYDRLGSGLGAGRGQVLLCGDEHDAALVELFELTK